ncbi:MAG: ABC transporter permease [Rhodocyclaceae bacterium]|nr:ABC transporter permease [Rhodocyclaceae bacterium]
MSQGIRFGRTALPVLAVVLVVAGWVQSQAAPDLPLAAPDARHWLGTDDLGRDVLGRLIEAAPATIGVGLAVGGGAMALAFSLALFGLAGRLADGFVLRLADVFNALPVTLILVAVASAFRPGMAALIGLLVLFGWDAELRTLRARLREVWRHESLDAARIASASNLYLLRRHVIPAMAGLIAVLTVGLVRRGIFHYAGLAFLGLVDPRRPTWGSMLNEAMPWLAHPVALWCAVPPGICLALLLIGLALLGQGLEEKIWKAP